MLLDKAELLLLYNGSLATFVFFLEALLFELHLSLSSVDCQLFLPESFDLSLVLQLTHPSFLGVHLFKSLIVSELLSELLLELILHSQFLSETLLLKSLLVSLGSKEIVLNLLALLHFFSFANSRLFFKLLHVEFIPEVLNVLVLSAAFFFFLLQFLEDFFTSGLSLCLLSLNLCLTAFLLLSIATEHLVFVFLELSLFLLKLSLLVDRLNHIKL
jgi:hypothetical protein